MKVKWDAYTDYPILDSQDREVHKVKVLKYDDNKYCDIQAYDPHGYLMEETFCVKIGYLYIDNDMTKKPNRKSVEAWTGRCCPEKKRIKKTHYVISIMCNGASSKIWLPPLDKDFNCFQSALKMANSCFQKGSNACRGNNILDPLTEIEYVLITKVVKSRFSSQFGSDYTYIEFNKKSKAPQIVWKQSWSRSHK